MPALPEVAGPHVEAAISGASSWAGSPSLNLSSLTELSGWLATLAQQPHILQDSADLLRKIATTTISAEARLWKLVVKDFYMSGGHDELAEFCGSTIEEGVAF